MAYTIRFPQKDAKLLEDMSNSEGISKAELIRRAINFYNIKIKTLNENKKLYFESQDGTKEWIVI